MVCQGLDAPRQRYRVDGDYLIVAHHPSVSALHTRQWLNGSEMAAICSFTLFPRTKGQSSAVSLFSRERNGSHLPFHSFPANGNGSDLIVAHPPSGSALDFFNHQSALFLLHFLRITFLRMLHFFSNHVAIGTAVYVCV
jgi:hypothetical protein